MKVVNFFKVFSFKLENYTKLFSILIVYEILDELNGFTIFSKLQLFTLSSNMYVNEWHTQHELLHMIDYLNFL